MRDRLGGTCLNVGCIQQGALCRAVTTIDVNLFSEHGITMDNVKMDDKMQDSKAKSVEGLTGNIEFLLKRTMSVL
jgi:pyruvate/2-oxoglutarate dehydrogenase complex dihydrolipoamide dehydrogenase (E3) component